MTKTRADTVNFRDVALKSGTALQRTDRGAVVPCIANIERILREDSRWDGVLGFNQMAYQVVKRKAPPYEGGAEGPWGDVDEIRTQIWLSREYGFNALVTDVRKAMMSVAAFRPFHPVRDYLDALTWDGAPRLLEMACTHFGAQDAGERGEYSMLVLRKWMIAAVARIYRPGCKADNVLILEGPQGRLKSSALELLGGEWCMDTPFHIGSKDAFLVLQGMWIVELAELDGFTRAESSAAKAFFSSPKDRYVPKYVAHAIDVPRSCVFAGTVNLGTYLHDRTGNRRYWPVQVGDIDLEALARDRDQLWAEAAALFHDKVPHWVTPDEVEKFAVEQEAREIPDAIEDKIRDYLIGQDEVTIGAVLEFGLKLDIKDWSQAMHTRVGQLLNRMGWEVCGRRRGEGRDRPRLYRPKAFGARSTLGHPAGEGGPQKANPDKSLS